MKVSKIFGCVLGLHLGVIGVLLVQPGCSTTQPPTQTYKQESTIKTSKASKASIPGVVYDSNNLILDNGSDVDSLDSAFNAGFEAGDDFTEFDGIGESVEPIAPIKPIAPIDAGQTVEIQGSSLQSYTVKKGDNLWNISKKYDVSLNELYAANGLNKNSVLRIGQTIQIPVDGASGTVSTVTPDTYQPTSFNQASTTYKVRGGDTLSGIAKKYNTSVSAIKAANGKSGDMIRVGEELLIPVDGSTPTVSPAPTPAPTSSFQPTPGARTHTVLKGEYPAKIARQYGMNTSELLSLNGISDPRKLREGQVLKLSASGSSANVDTRTETVVTPAPTTITATQSVTATSLAPSDSSPVSITVIEADPLLNGEVIEIGSDEELIEGALEVPVIRLEE